MAVTSTKPYVGVPRDLVQNFHGKQIVYVCWDHHMLFSAPLMTVVEPGMRFADFLDNVLKGLIAPDPDGAKVDFSKVEWKRANQPFKPDFNASLKDNGIGHKTQLRFHTPGLNSLLAEAA